MKATILTALAVFALSGAAQAHEPYPAYGSQARQDPGAAYAEHERWSERREAVADDGSITLQNSFFADAGGVGPAFVESGYGGSDRFYVFSTASAGAHAFASAHAGASVRIHSGGGHHCGCH